MSHPSQPPHGLPRSDPEPPPPIDRISPTRRPRRWPIMRQDWRELLFLHWPVPPAQPGTLEHFLIERYLLYAVANDRLYQGQVHHNPYPLQSAEIHSLDEQLLAAAGLARPDTAPLAHFARGVDVEIFALQSA